MRLTGVSWDTVCTGWGCSARAVRASETGGGWEASLEEQADSQKALLEMEPKSCGSTGPVPLSDSKVGMGR